MSSRAAQRGETKAGVGTMWQALSCRRGDTTLTDAIQASSPPEWPPPPIQGCEGDPGPPVNPYWQDGDAFKSGYPSPPSTCPTYGTAGPYGSGPFAEDGGIMTDRRTGAGQTNAATAIERQGAVYEVIQPGPMQGEGPGGGYVPIDAPKMVRAGWTLHSGDLPEHAAELGLGQVRRLGQTMWHKGFDGVLFRKHIGMGQDGTTDAGGAVDASGGSTGDTGFTFGGSGNDTTAANPSGGGGTTNTSATPSSSNGSGGGGASVPSTSTTSTSTTTTTSTSLATPILIGAGVLAVGIIGWAALAPTKSKHIRHAAREEDKRSREHARRAARLYRRAAEHQAAEGR